MNIRFVHQEKKKFKRFALYLKFENRSGLLEAKPKNQSPYMKYEQLEHLAKASTKAEKLNKDYTITAHAHAQRQRENT